MATTNVPDDLELLIHLDRGMRRSLQRQLLDQLRAALLRGQLAPGRRLPATRKLSAAFGISRNVVEEVYDKLVVEGYLERRHGSGTYVGNDIFGIDILRPPPPSRPALDTQPRWLRTWGAEDAIKPACGPAIV